MSTSSANYRFAESEDNHAKRLDASFRGTRIKRKALITLLTGHEYPGQPKWVKQMTIDQLTHRLCATVQLSKLIVPDEDRRTVAEKTEDGAHNEDGQRGKTEKRIQAGHRIGSVPYPYQTGPDGAYLSAEWGRALAEIFSLLLAGWGYADVAHQLNDLHLETATGAVWNKDNARGFCQLAEHCGYAKKPVTPGNKHGPFYLYFPFALPTINPPVSQADWLAANPNLLPKFKGVLAHE